MGGPRFLSMPPPSMTSAGLHAHPGLQLPDSIQRRREKTYLRPEPPVNTQIADQPTFPLFPSEQAPLSLRRSPFPVTSAGFFRLSCACFGVPAHLATGIPRTLFFLFFHCFLGPNNISGQKTMFEHSRTMFFRLKHCLTGKNNVWRLQTMKKATAARSRRRRWLIAEVQCILGSTRRKPPVRGFHPSAAPRIRCSEIGGHHETA